MLCMLENKMVTLKTQDPSQTSTWGLELELIITQNYKPKSSKLKGTLIGFWSFQLHLKLFIQKMELVQVSSHDQSVKL